MAARYETKRAVIEAALREQDVIPEGTVTVQAGIDGVMVPKDGQHAKPRGRKTDSPEPPRCERPYGAVDAGAPGEEDGSRGRAWHEASVATLAFFDADGVRLKTTYVARMSEPSKATTVSTLKAELLDVFRERPDLNIAFASDGAARQWSALEGIKISLPASFTGHTVDLVDAFHVAEYLQKAADAIEGTDSPGARILSAAWRETIKEDGGPMTVLRSMGARLPSVTSRTRAKELTSAIGYVANQRSVIRRTGT